jgi:hypothetical protein
MYVHENERDLERKREEKREVVSDLPVKRTNVA